MENQITGCVMQNNSTKYFETTDFLTDYLPKELTIYYLSQWHRIVYGCKANYKLHYNPDAILNPSQYFWGKMVDEIVDAHHHFSLAKISIETDIDLHFIGKIWVGQINAMPLDIGQKLLTLHQKRRTNLQ